MDHEPITIESIRRLDVRPGDVVVVTLALPTTVEQAWRIREQIKEALTGVKVLVLAGGIELAVYTPDAELVA